MPQILSLESNPPPRHRLPASAGFQPGDATLIDRLNTRADLTPDHPALVCIEGKQALMVTNRELRTMAREIAGRLSVAGLRAGDPAIIALETSADAFAAFLACLLLSAVPCIVETPAGKASVDAFVAKVQQRAAHVNARLVIARESHVEVLREAGLPATTLESLPDAEPLARRPLPNDAAFLQFTSGTTGRPKAVLVSHETLFANSQAMFNSGEWRADDVMVSWLPLYHDMGLVVALLTGFAGGMPVVLMQPNAFTLNPTRWVWAMHSFYGTLSPGPNFAYRFLAKNAPEHRLKGLDLSSWRQAFNAAEFVHKATIDAFCERFESYGFTRDAFVPAYGMAECTVASTMRRMNEPLRFDIVSRRVMSETGHAIPTIEGTADAMALTCVGRAVDQHTITIVDPEGRALPDRMQGEIVVQGPSVVSGYHLETEPHRAFRDGRLYTGDLGYIDDGFVFVTGRMKDLIIRAGTNISPYDIERVASEVEGVRAGAVAAVGVRDDQKGTELLAVFFENTLADYGPTAHAIHEALVQKLGVAPDHVWPLPPHTIQKTTSGKLRREELSQRAYEYLAPQPERSAEAA